MGGKQKNNKRGQQVGSISCKKKKKKKKKKKTGKGNSGSHCISLRGGVKETGGQIKGKYPEEKFFQGNQKE